MKHRSLVHVAALWILDPVTFCGMKTKENTDFDLSFDLV